MSSTSIKQTTIGNKQDEQQQDEKKSKVQAAEPGLTEEETEQMKGLEDARKNKDTPGGPGHLTDSERTLLTNLKNKVEEAKKERKDAKEEAKK